MEKTIEKNSPEDLKAPISEDHHKRPKGLATAFIVILVFLVVAMFIAGYVLVMSGSNQQDKAPLIEFSNPSLSPSITKVPFEEMTIPYLRNRSYESSIDILEEVSSNVNYTSYRVSYDSDGLTIYGQLTEPTGEVPSEGYPAIIFVHGYIPPSTYETFSSYGSYVDNLARNGFVVFKIDLRGHGNSEGDASGAYYSGDYIVDVLNARSALQGLDFVNSQRIGIWGHSMAGNVAFRSFVAAQDIPAIVIWAGAVYTYEDWQEYGLDDNSYRPPDEDSERQRRRQELFNTHGEFDSNSSFWRQVVPVNYLDDVRGAVQLNHAVNDDVVNIGYSRGLDEILDGSLITHEFNEHESGGHNISGASFTQAMEDTVRFFKENL